MSPLSPFWADFTPKQMRKAWSILAAGSASAKAAAPPAVVSAALTPCPQPSSHLHGDLQGCTTRGCRFVGRSSSAHQAATLQVPQGWVVAVRALLCPSSAPTGGGRASGCHHRIVSLPQNVPKFPRSRINPGTSITDGLSPEFPQIAADREHSVWGVCSPGEGGWAPLLRLSMSEP